MTKSSAADKPTNPFLDAKREWNERYGTYISEAKTWRLVAVASLLVAGVAVTGLAVSASQNKLVPYVVEVDKLHATLPIGPADRAAKVDTRIIRAQLASLIGDLRSVYLDAAAEQTAIRRAYAMLAQNGTAYQVVNEQMASNDPFKRAQLESVTIEVQSVLPLGGDTWRVEWIETVRDRSGVVTSSQPWQAAVTTTINPPTSEAGVLANPLGLYVTALSWSPRAQ